jgi:hypothetical protein
LEIIKYPVAGARGKAWKITSNFGWRVHPKTGAKKFHNGVDIWQGKEPTPLQACFTGKVVGVSTSTDPNGAGNKVVVQSTVGGKKVTWTYFHMVNKSIKVKVGQVIEAGHVVGLMGDTGFATGKHVHFEIWDGHRTVQPNINNGGKGFQDPMKFIANALIAQRAETPEASPVTPLEAPKVVSAPVTAIQLQNGSKGEQVKLCQSKLGITADGIFGKITEAAVRSYQAKKGIKVTGIIDQETYERLLKK